MDFLSVQGKTFLITGLANKKSVAYHTAMVLKDFGAELIFTVQNEKSKMNVERYFPHSEVFILDVEIQQDIEKSALLLKEKGVQLDGLLHSIAFANFSDPRPFHETKWEDYLQADRISCFSLTAICNALKDLFKEDASVVTLSISNTKVTSYGYMGPIKASLDVTVAYLAKSFSSFSNIRFNTVQSGPLKTSASAGIPGYVDNYIYAEKLTLRKRGLKTEEVAQTAAFLLSPQSSGINGTGLLVDAGIHCNYFDEEVVKIVTNS